jgi:hypothetical protein
MTRSPLATPEQRDAERLALRLIEAPAIRAAREAARALLLADPIVHTPDGRAGLDRALDQWGLALAMRVVNADPFRPAVVWNVYNPARHWFGHTYLGAAVAIDNPDNSNREIPIDGGSIYEIRGQFGTPATQFTIEVVTDFDGYAGIGRTLAALTSQRIEADADGRFVITVGGDAAGRTNHLPSEPGCRTFIFCRDSMADWKQVPTALSVTRIAGPEAPPPRDEATIIADIVASMPTWVRFWNGFKDDFLGLPDPNRLVGPIGRPGGWGFLYGGRFRVGGDDALIVTTTGGGANYTGFQIADPWTISPDPIHRLASLNRSQSRANPDGSTTYVLAARDPGVHNWIDTTGLSEGWMLLRWQGVPPDIDPAALVRSVEAVKLADLAAALPADVPMADISSRAEQIAGRIADHALRLAE